MPGAWQGSALDSALTWALAIGAPTEKLVVIMPTATKLNGPVLFVDRQSV
jgi:hypothetical protein